MTMPMLKDREPQPTGKLFAARSSGTARSATTPSNQAVRGPFSSLLTPARPRVVAPGARVAVAPRCPDERHDTRERRSRNQRLYVFPEQLRAAGVGGREARGRLEVVGHAGEVRADGDEVAVTELGDSAPILGVPEVSRSR